MSQIIKVSINGYETSLYSNKFVIFYERAIHKN